MRIDEHSEEETLARAGQDGVYLPVREAQGRSDHKPAFTIQQPPRPWLP